MKVIFADAAVGLRTIPDESVDCVVTSPPYYGLRDYGCEDQIGLEESPRKYIDRLVDVFRDIRRVLKPEGTVWVVIGDSYAGSGKGAAMYPENGAKYKQGTNHGSVGVEKIARIPKTFDNGRIKEKDLLEIPWMFAFAMREDGWYLRQDIIWAKPNPMPESVRDRCTRSHEYIFLFSKSRRYFYDAEAISEPVAKSTTKRLAQKVEDQKGSDRAVGKSNGPMKACYPRYGGRQDKSCAIYEPHLRRNKRDVWTVTTRGYKGAHFATFPPDLIRPCVLSGCPEGGTVLDPFCGSGTTLQVARECGRDGIGIELNKEYLQLIANRVGDIEVRT